MIAAFQSLWVWLTSTFAGKIIASCFVSMLPVFEIRGGIPIATGLGLAPRIAIPLCVLANCIPVIPILILMNHILLWMRSCGGILSKFANWLERKANKHRDLLDKYAWFGLFLLTALPLPGTGAWTASLLASLARVRMRMAAPAIMGGVVTAGAIVSFVSYGIAALI